jgi:hypothetical protein
MSTFYRKTALLAALYLLLHLTDACIVTCDCPDVNFPYFEYHKIVVNANDPRTANSLRLQIQPDSVQLVAQATLPSWRFSSAAYGCKCTYDGYLGDKVAPSNIDVFADKPFNDTLPAGASLRSIFLGVTLGDIVTPLSESFRPERFGNESGDYSISTMHKPANTADEFRFTIQWVKANGDTLIAQSGPVRF